MRAEDFFPLGWLDRQFRRQPYPDMTYREALVTAWTVFWNIDSKDSRELLTEISKVEVNMELEHAAFPGRSMQSVSELNELWRGKVTTLLKWFQQRGGS